MRSSHSFAVLWKSIAFEKQNDDFLMDSRRYIFIVVCQFSHSLDAIVLIKNNITVVDNHPSLQIPDHPQSEIKHEYHSLNH